MLSSTPLQSYFQKQRQSGNKTRRGPTQLQQAVLSPPHMCDSTHAHMCIHTHKQIKIKWVINIIGTACYQISN